MHPTKASGPDGTITLFLKHFWEFLGQDVTDKALHILNDEGDPTSINKTHIDLIPTVKNPIHASDFRPNNLCKCDF